MHTGIWSLLPHRFSSRVRFATLGTLGMLVLLAILFYTITDRYQNLLTHSDLARDVMQSYLEVSDHTYRKLNAMGEIVANADVGSDMEREANALSLRDSLIKLRQEISAEAAFMRDQDAREELEQLAEIDRVVERIVTISLRLRAAVDAGDLSQARAELTAVRGDAIAGRFSELIDMALSEERREMQATQDAAQSLGRLISWALPLFVLIVAVFGVGATVVISRSLAGSVDTLRDAALAYASGDFAYRTDELYEAEFAELGNAFDRLGEQLGKRFSVEQHSKAELESLVAERTQGLRETNEELARADRSRRRLLADISHELRTPMTVIHGEAEMALRGESKTMAEYEDSLNRIREQVLHTNRLVEDLLFVARAEEGQARVQMRSVAISGLIKAVCADFAATAEKKQIRITQSIGDDYIVVSGDHDRLRQVFTILLDNALRYSDVDGHVQVSLKQAEEGVEIIVKDDGIGLSPEDAEQVFLRFYRGANAQDAVQGTGLGLPVAKAIVEAHQGKIGITGQVGEGAEARVWLPIEDRIRAVS